MSPDTPPQNTSLHDCFGADRKRLRQLHAQRRDKRMADKQRQQAEAQYHQLLTQSLVKVTTRREQLPKIQYPEELPVVAAREQIAAAISAHQVVIICGDTGSGKTTQLPKLCMQLGRGVRGFIGHTQPRRLATRSVATRITEELQQPNAVGFKVRFTDTVQASSYLKVMTDGVLLNELRHDPLLEHYDTLIIDEAHERSLNIDFLLGVLKKILPRRPDLKLIITSATIDPDRFAGYFHNAPVILVEGRSYPVEIRYRPATESAEANSDPQQHLQAAIRELWAQGAGDILVFFATEREIRDAEDFLNKQWPDSEILPLFGRLSHTEQQRIFAPHKKRRIVLATNVAETSLTVPGISYVIDTGMARLSRYSVSSKVQRLPIEKISQASAQQRAGRCGRLGPGICIRLYSEDDFLNRPAFTDPEIHRTNLAAVILQMATLNLGEVTAFPFIEPPELRYINDGYRLLQELAAMDQQRRITALGKHMARLAVDPCLARVLVASHDLACLQEALIIVAALEIQDPRERPLEHAQRADQAHASFHDKRSDFVALLNLWRAFQENSQLLSKSKLRLWCQQYFLSYLRMREWQDLHTQLQQQCRELKLTANQKPADYANLHAALISGFPSHIATREQDDSYLGARQQRLYLFPGSGLEKKPRWLLSAEIVETSKVFARCVADIDTLWIEKQLPHLLKKTYSNPRWNLKRGRVIADEQAALYGLIIYAGRRATYSQIDPQAARDIFIRDGLVPGKLQSPPGFIKHNLQLIAAIEQLEDQARRRDLLLEAEQQYQFYEQRLPAAIVDVASLNAWLAKLSVAEQQALQMSMDYLLRNDLSKQHENDFPPFMQFATTRLALSYCFEPGKPEDGVTLHIPLALLNQVDAQVCDWLVPGLLLEKITELIRGLPKQLRKNFVPAPDFARACLDNLSGQGCLYSNISQHLQRMTGAECPETELRAVQLPLHLQLRLVLHDDEQILDSSRDLQALKQTWAAKAQQQLLQQAHEFEREQIRDWDFGELPEHISIDTGSYSSLAYPCLLLEKQGLALRLLNDADAAQQQMRIGMRELVKICLRKEVNYLQRNLSGFAGMALQFVAISDSDSLRADLINAAIDACFIHEQVLPRDRQTFLHWFNNNKPQLVEHSNRLAATAAQAIELHHQLRKQLTGNLPLSWIEAVQDVQSQLEQLIFPGFITAIGAQQLQHLPRYLQAIQRRLTVLTQQPDQDRKRRAELGNAWAHCLELLQLKPRESHLQTAIDELHWFFEELRVATFAQQLGTAMKVSLTRVEAQLKHCQLQLRNAGYSVGN